MKTTLFITGIFFLSIVTIFIFATQKTEIEINNPFRIEITSCEVKCDYDYKIKGYRYYKIIKIPKKGNYKLVVPYGLKKCEIWPLKVSLF